MKLEEFSAIGIGQLVNTKELSPVEVIQYFINRIEERNHSINAFTYTMFEDALKEAEEMQKRQLRGEYLGKFAAVPVGLKDFLPSKKGWTNSHGGVPCLVRKDDADSEFYKAARRMGAIAIGKTNAPAFGFSGACSNKMYGATKNPFNLSRTTGGSSGGSAAAVADGLLGLSEGGDAGGSIRIPSGWCNLFGFKSSLGTVPSYCRPDGWSATHPYCFNGALTRTVLDSAAIMSEMARYNPRDPISLPINSNKDFYSLINADIKGKKIGFTIDFGLYNVAKEVETIVTDAVKSLENAGAEIVPLKFSWKHSLDEITRCWAWSISVDTALDIEQWKSEGLDLIKDHRDEIPEEFIYFNEMAARATIHDFRTFNEIRTDILDNFEDAFEECDIIASPVAICNPMLLTDAGRCKSVNGVELNPETNFISFAETLLVNFIGYPAASVPVGIHKETNCPVGLQIIGKQYHDLDVFSLSRAIEQIRPWKSHYQIPFSRKL